MCSICQNQITTANAKSKLHLKRLKEFEAHYLANEDHKNSYGIPSLEIFVEKSDEPNSQPLEKPLVGARQKCSTDEMHPTSSKKLNIMETIGLHFIHRLSAKRIN